MRIVRFWGQLEIMKCDVRDWGRRILWCGVMEEKAFVKRGKGERSFGSRIILNFQDSSLCFFLIDMLNFAFNINLLLRYAPFHQVAAYYLPSRYALLLVRGRFVPSPRKLSLFLHTSRKALSMYFAPSTLHLSKSFLQSRPPPTLPPFPHAPRNGFDKTNIQDQEQSTHDTFVTKKLMHPTMLTARSTGLVADQS